MNLRALRRQYETEAAQGGTVTLDGRDLESDAFTDALQRTFRVPRLVVDQAQLEGEVDVQQTEIPLGTMKRVSTRPQGVPSLKQRKLGGVPVFQEVTIAVFGRPVGLAVGLSYPAIPGVMQVRTRLRAETDGDVGVRTWMHLDERRFFLRGLATLGGRRCFVRAAFWRQAGVERFSVEIQLLGRPASEDPLEVAGLRLARDAPMARAADGVVLGNLEDLTIRTASWYFLSRATRDRSPLPFDWPAGVTWVLGFAFGANLEGVAERAHPLVLVGQMDAHAYGPMLDLRSTPFNLTFPDVSVRDVSLSIKTEVATPVDVDVDGPETNLDPEQGKFLRHDARLVGHWVQRVMGRRVGVPVFSDLPPDHGFLSFRTSPGFRWGTRNLGRLKNFTGGDLDWHVTERRMREVLNALEEKFPITYLSVGIDLPSQQVTDIAVRVNGGGIGVDNAPFVTILDSEITWLISHPYGGSQRSTLVHIETWATVGDVNFVRSTLEVPGLVMRGGADGSGWISPRFREAVEAVRVVAVDGRPAVEWLLYEVDFRRRRLVLGEVRDGEVETFNVP